MKTSLIVFIITRLCKGRLKVACNSFPSFRLLENNNEEISHRSQSPISSRCFVYLKILAKIMKTRVAARRKAKKRKICNANISRSQGQDDGSNYVDESRPGPSHELEDATDDGRPQNSTPVQQTKIFKRVDNVTKRKLINSYFLRMSPVKKRCLTRKKAIELGLSKMKKTETAQGCSLMALQNLSDCILKAAICQRCKSAKSRLSLLEVKAERKGLAQKLLLKCNLCDNESSFSTSSKAEPNKPFDINVKSVYGASSQGLGHAGLTRLCGTLDLPKPVNHKPFDQILKNLSNSAQKLAEKKMRDAAVRLLQIIKMEDPENVREVADGRIIANVAVTVDGTWQRRGHSSKNGVVFVLSVRTGEVLDYVVKTKYCQRCVYHMKHNNNSQSYEEWMESHSKECSMNHIGPSDSMETEGAVEMFLRSIDTRSLRYATFVGDGDTDCFGNVAEACSKKYGDQYVVKKEECVGHIQKRLGTALRKYKISMKGKKLQDGKTVGGKARLTDKVIDKMQNFFGQVIRNNSGAKENMKSDILAILKHMVKDDRIHLDQQHQNCPKDSTSWCKYWSNRESYNDDKRLPSAFFDELKPIFSRLSADELLNRCLLGLTQNQNEAINGILWSKCPKRKFCGREKLLLAVAETVCEFNTGAACLEEVLNQSNIHSTSNSFTIFRNIDSTRLNHAAKKISMKARLQRRKLRATRKGGAEKGTSYISGAFGVQKTPELNLHVGFAITERKILADEPEIRFIDDRQIFMVKEERPRK